MTDETQLLSPPAKRPSTPPKRQRPADSSWRVVALDNDETTGSWGQGSLLYMLWLRVLGHKPLVSDFVDKYLALGGARPGMIELLRHLHQMKTSGRIDEVVMFTGASDHDGWVTFLKDCLEEYAGTPGLFGRLLSRQHNSRTACDGSGRMWKDLSLVSPKPEQVVLIDDKPEYCLNGTVVGVSEYREFVPTSALTELLQSQVKSVAQKNAISRVIERDAEEHRIAPLPKQHTQDSWLSNTVLPRLTSAFSNSLDDAFMINLTELDVNVDINLDFRRSAKKRRSTETI